MDDDLEHSTAYTILSDSEEEILERHSRQRSWILLFERGNSEEESSSEEEDREAEIEMVKDPDSYYDFYFTTDDDIYTILKNPSKFCQNLPPLEAEPRKDSSSFGLSHKQDDQNSAKSETITEVAEENKIVPIAIYCGNCSMLLGNSDTLTAELVSVKTENRNVFHKSNVYKCLVCQAVETQYLQLWLHVLDHCKDREIFCEGCKAGWNFERSSYELGLLDSAEIEVSSEVEEASASEASDVALKDGDYVPCGHCGKFFGHTIDVVSRLIGISRGIWVIKTSITDHSCLICGQHSKLDDWFKTHILKHFRFREVYCTKCLRELRSSGGTTRDADNFSTFIPYQFESDEQHAIRCGKCNIYLADYGALIMKKMVGTTGEELRKSQIKPAYECLLCSAERRDGLMERHIQRHVSSVEIICFRCQEEDDPAYGCSFRRILNRFDKVLALGNSEKYDVCQKCYRSFISAEAIADVIDIFRLKEKSRKGYTRERILYTCLLCQMSTNCPHDIRRHASFHSPNEKLLCISCNNDE